MSSKRILVVEDDEAIRRMEQSLLVAAGYEVDAFPNAEAAKASLTDNEPPALAILDVMMPGESGFDMSSKMKDDPRLSKVPVIFVTARTDANSLNEGFKAGGVLYLTKPFNSQKFLSMVKTVLGF